METANTCCMKSIGFALLLLMALPAKTQSVRIDTVTIEPFMSFQNYEHFKRLVLNSDPPGIEFIEDFTFDWGHRYELLVECTEMEYELSDGTSATYKYVKEISKSKVPDTFSFKLFLDGFLYYNDGGFDEQVKTLEVINDSTFLYFEEVRIEVPKNLRSEFLRISNGEIEKLGHFTFGPEQSTRLTKFH